VSWRQNLLILNGWCVLRFTWTMVEDHPERVIAMVRDAIKMLTAVGRRRSNSKRSRATSWTGPNGNRGS
jgi:very-short-patch-repair endonuclease